MGTAVFSVIGDDRCRNFVICGSSIQDIKYTRRVCLPGDIVLCESAWQYCVPSHYEYVLKDADNVKVGEYNNFTNLERIFKSFEEE